jgi:hypothetical protein
MTAKERGNRKSGAAFETIFRISDCFQRSKQKFIIPYLFHDAVLKFKNFAHVLNPSQATLRNQFLSLPPTQILAFRLRIFYQAYIVTYKCSLHSTTEALTFRSVKSHRDPHKISGLSLTACDSKCCSKRRPLF